MMTSQILKSVDFMLTQKSRILISKEDQSRWNLRGKIWAKIKPHTLKKNLKTWQYQASSYFTGQMPVKLKIVVS